MMVRWTLRLLLGAVLVGGCAPGGDEGDHAAMVARREAYAR
jgi:hypothetical protein